MLMCLYLKNVNVKMKKSNTICWPMPRPSQQLKQSVFAFSLVQLFSRVWFAREILTDRGTNFMSTLLKQVYQLLGIKCPNYLTWPDMVFQSTSSNLLFTFLYGHEVRGPQTLLRETWEGDQGVTEAVNLTRFTPRGAKGPLKSCIETFLKSWFPDLTAQQRYCLLTVWREKRKWMTSTYLQRLPLT